VAQTGKGPGTEGKSKKGESVGKSALGLRAMIPPTREKVRNSKAAAVQRSMGNVHKNLTSPFFYVFQTWRVKRPQRNKQNEDSENEKSKGTKEATG